jgi:hypothetical protein
VHVPGLHKGLSNAQLTENLANSQLDDVIRVDSNDSV